MLNDIFATSMHGRYSTTDSGRIVEQGEWSYRGFGNAEISMAATADRPDEALRFELRLHSAERQLDEVSFRTMGDGPAHAFHAKIAGHVLMLATPDDDAGETVGNLAVPPESVYDGPSPIWLIHLAMTAPPPTDRQVTTPIIRFPLGGAEVSGGFYRFGRDGNAIHVALLDEHGHDTGAMTITLDEDGCPRSIVSGTLETEIMRLASA